MHFAVLIRLKHVISQHGPLRGQRVSLLLVYIWIPIFPSVKTYIFFSLLRSYVLLTYALFNESVNLRYANHRNKRFMYFFTKCALKLPLIIAWPVVTLLIYP